MALGKGQQESGVREGKGQQAFENDVEGVGGNRHQTQGGIMKSCDEGRRFKVGEVDSEER